MEKETNIMCGRIGGLLEKYLDGTTSLEEETILKDYFTTVEEVPSGLEYARAMFGYFEATAKETTRGAIHPGGPAPALPARDRQDRKRGLLYYLAGAAGAAAVIALIMIFPPRKELLPAADNTVYCYINGKPVTDLELAMEYTHQTFDHISDAVSAPMPRSSVFEAFEKLEYITGIVEVINNNRR